MTRTTVVIEIPKGSNNKYAVDPISGRVHLERELIPAMTYPVDYGYIERARSEDDDPIGAFVMLRNPVFPGVTVDVRLVGALVVTEGSHSEIKVLAVPANDPHWKQLRSLGDVPPNLRAQLEFFVAHNKDLSPRKHHVIVRWSTAEHTQTTVDIARLRFDTHSVGSS